MHRMVSDEARRVTATFSPLHPHDAWLRSRRPHKAKTSGADVCFPAVPLQHAQAARTRIQKRIFWAYECDLFDQLATQLTSLPPFEGNFSPCEAFLFRVHKASMTHVHCLFHAMLPTCGLRPVDRFHSRNNWKTHNGQEASRTQSPRGETGANAEQSRGAATGERPAG